MVSFNSTEHLSQHWIPSALMISIYPQNWWYTPIIVPLHSTDGILLKYWRYPSHTTEHPSQYWTSANGLMIYFLIEVPLQYWSYPFTILNSSTVMKIFHSTAGILPPPTILDILHSTEHPPQYCTDVTLCYFVNPSRSYQFVCDCFS